MRYDEMVFGKSHFRKGDCFYAMAATVGVLRGNKSQNAELFKQIASSNIVLFFALGQDYHCTGGDHCEKQSAACGTCPAQRPRAKRKPGLLKGRIRIPDDFLNEDAEINAMKL